MIDSVEISAFFVTLILREIDFGGYERSKNDILSSDPKFFIWVNFSFQKMQKFIKDQH